MILCILLSSSVTDVSSEPDGLEQAILAISGAAELEDLDEDEIERYRHFAAHPLPLNFAARSRLVSSGLLTPYRAASLLDYRQRNGDVLSLTELAAVDGFGREFVAALAPFVSLESSSLPGQRLRDGHSYEHEAALRSSAKYQNPSKAGERGEADWNLASKYLFTLDDSFEAGIAFKEPYGSPHSHPEAGAFHCSYSGRRWLSSLVLGDFQCRFGQGLCLWSGFSIGSLDRTTAAYRNPTFVSPYRGYDDSASLKGAAATFSFGHFNFSALLAHPGLAASNLSWYCRNGQLGLTGYYCPTGAKISADARWNIQGVDLFGEFAFDIYNMVPAAIVGARSSIGSYLKLAGLLRYYPTAYDPSYSGAARGSTKCSDEHGVTLLGDWHSDGYDHRGNFSADVVYRPSKRPEGPLSAEPLQIKLNSLWSWQVKDWLKLSAKALYRYRGYDQFIHRAELRSDLVFGTDDWSAGLRCHAAYSSSLAGLVYADGLYRSGVFSIYGRLTAFHIDKWADRIYCYERDVPGSFSVTACYGRGLSAALVAGLNLPCGLKIHFRISTLQYPTRDNPSRIGKSEARLQLTYRCRVSGRS